MVPKTATQFVVQRVTILPLCGLLYVLGGCATKQPVAAASPPRIGHGAEEYQKLTAHAISTMLEALRWLEQVNAQTKSCPPHIVEGFAKEVEHLQVDSIEIREHAQAIQTRGDAYFEAWEGNLSDTNAPQSAKVAEYLPKLHEAFTQIKLTSRQVGESFHPFFDRLRKLQIELEADPRIIDNPDTRELIRTTRQEGLLTVDTLGKLCDELAAAIPLINRAKAEAHL